MKELAQGAHFASGSGSESRLWHGGKNLRGERGEGVVLIGEAGEGESGLLRDERDGSEVDVRGEVLRAGIGERVVDALVVAVGGESAGGAGGLVTDGGGVPVVDEQEPAALKFGRESYYPGFE